MLVPSLFDMAEVWRVTSELLELKRTIALWLAITHLSRNILLIV